MSAIKAIRSDPFFMLVVDLSLPIEPKLSLVRETYHYQPDVRVITIEKGEYLKKTGALSSFSSVVSIDSIESFPDKLEA
jgi:ActR/RegA family two-component response regulator